MIFATVEQQTKQSNIILFDCKLFIVTRNRLLASFRAVSITSDTLLYGHDLLTFETNKELQKTVLQFIKDKGTFK